MWLLVVKQICNEKEQAGQKETQNVQFEEENTNRDFNVGTQLCAERDKEKRNKESGCLRAVPCPADPEICEKKRAKELSVHKKFKKPKAYTNIIQGEGQVSTQGSNGTWQHWPCGFQSHEEYMSKEVVDSSYKIKESHMCVAGESLPADPERLLVETINVKPGLHWNLQDVGTVGHFVCQGKFQTGSRTNP